MEALARAYSFEMDYILLLDHGTLISAMPVLKGRGIAYKSFSGTPQMGVPYCSALGSTEIYRHLGYKVLGWREHLIIYRLNLDEAVSMGKPVLKTNMVSLDVDEDEIWKESFSKTTRKSVRRSLEAGLEIREPGLEAMDEFIALDVGHHKRIGMAVDERRHRLLRYLAEMPGSPNHVRLFAAYFENRIVEMSIMIHNNYIAHAWITAKQENSDLGNLSTKSVLHWHAIKVSKSLGCRYYDLCVVDENRLPGIAAFKMGFSKRMYYVNEIRYHGKIFSALNRVQKCMLKNV